MKRSYGARAALVRLRKEIAATLAMLARAFVSGLLWFLLLTIAGLGLLVGGVFVLAGLGWSLVAGGLACIAAAAFIRKGLTGG